MAGNFQDSDEFMETGRKSLGFGFFGEAIQVRCKHTNVVYVAKVWHKNMLDSVHGQLSTTKYMDKYHKIIQLRHVNLTQVVGVHYIEENIAPSIVMEKLDRNLEHLSAIHDISLSLKISIVYDICCGLAYLHSRNPPVVHGDLIPTNILLSTSLSAKISDVWNINVIGIVPADLARRLQSQKSKSLAFLPLKDLMTATEYKPSLDVFSLGRLMVHIMSLSLPDSEISEHAINDVEIKHKRMEILKVQLGHCFPEISSLLFNCGHEDPDKRPKCTAIRQTIQVVQENVQRIYGRKEVKIPYVMAALEMVAKERRMQILETDMKFLQVENSNLRRLMAPSPLNSEVSLGEVDFPQAEEEMGQRVEKSRIVKDIPEDKLRLKLKWTLEERTMPYGMSRYIQLIELDGILYIGGGETDVENEFKVMAYTISLQTWNILQPYNAKYFAMTAIDNSLTLVGGNDSSHKDVNSLGTWDGKKWMHIHESMPTHRSHCSVATYNTWLVVAGGTTTDHKLLCITEILNLDTNQWHRGPDTPIPWYSMKSALLNDTWYLMGGHSLLFDVFAVQLEELISGLTVSSPWKRLPKLGSVYSTPVVMGDELLAVCGRLYAYKSDDGIYVYSEDKDMWILAGRMPCKVCNCACAVVSDKILVFGGHDGKYCQSSVYSASIEHTSVS